MQLVSAWRLTVLLCMLWFCAGFTKQLAIRAMLRKQVATAGWVAWLAWHWASACKLSQLDETSLPAHKASAQAECARKHCVSMLHC